MCNRQRSLLVVVVVVSLLLVGGPGDTSLPNRLTDTHQLCRSRVKVASLDSTGNVPGCSFLDLVAVVEVEKRWPRGEDGEGGRGESLKLAVVVVAARKRCAEEERER